MLRFCIIQGINAENKILIALVGLINTNAITLFLSRLLSKRILTDTEVVIFPLELFSVVFLANLG